MKKCNRVLSFILSTALLFATALPSLAFAAENADSVVWNDGDTVGEITISQDTDIVVKGTVTVTKSIKITGGNVSVSGGGKLMRAASNSGNNLFNIISGNVTFTDISIDGNNMEVTAYSAIEARGGNIVINDGTVIENNIKRKYINRTVGGAAICAVGAAEISMNGGILQNNTSHRRGGAVYLENGAIFNMNGGTVKNNKTEPDTDSDSVYGGGAFYVRDAELNITGGSIVNNAATLYRGNGGGIYNSSYGTTRITGGYISGNTANLSGNGIYHSSKEGTAAVFEIGGGTNVEDDIYLSSDNAYKYSKITSKLQSNIKFTVGDNSYDRVIAEGSNYTLTYADMAKMQVTNSDMALSLENNQIRLTQTANNTYTLYFGYDANGGNGTPESKELTMIEGADYPTETVDFTVIPTRAGYTFLGWDTDRSAAVPKYTAANAPQTITIDNNITLYAIWEKIPVNYEIKAISGNGGKVSGGGTVAEGSSITLTATANDGYTFDGWYDGNTKVCDTAEFVVTNVTEDKTYTAKFTKNIVYYTIFAEVGTDGGTVSGGGKSAEGSSITLTATANDGYTFDGWYDGDTKVCDTAAFVVSNVTADKTYTAKFTKNIVYYTISAEVGTDGGTVSGGGTVAEGSSITLTAAANDGYSFDGWYDGNTKVCDTAEFVVTNVTADKTYTAKFTKNQVVEPEPSGFDFTSLRTLKTKNITVNHETKTIDIDAADNAEYITVFVHQKDVIPGGTFKMASYLGNKVVYDKNGSYRVYYVHNFTVPVKANITVNGVTEQYSVNVHFDSSKAGFNFTSLKGENFSDVTVNHDDKTVHITANDSADNIILYVNQHNTVYGGKLRMASYLGNKVNYNSANGVYTIYANGKSSVSVKTNIAINGVTEQYLITVDFPAVNWGFDAVNAENVKNVSIDHENKVITIDTAEGADSILLYIDQTCKSGIKGQIWMKSYMGNKVVYNAADRTYTITKKDNNSITVKTKITMLGETRYYDININFMENE